MLGFVTMLIVRLEGLKFGAGGKGLPGIVAAGGLAGIRTAISLIGFANWQVNRSPPLRPAESVAVVGG